MYIRCVLHGTIMNHHAEISDSDASLPIPAQSSLKTVVWALAQVDPHFLKQMIEWDQAAGADAVVLWGLPSEAARIGSQEGIFAERHPPQSVVKSAQQEGPWQHVLQAWYPGYCNGYGGWHQTWTSRKPIQGNSTTIGVARDCCGHASAGPDEWFFAVLIRVDGKRQDSLAESDAVHDSDIAPLYP